jgi:hypothetical protein
VKIFFKNGRINRSICADDRPGIHEFQQPATSGRRSLANLLRSAASQQSRHPGADHRVRLEWYHLNTCLDSIREQAAVFIATVIKRYSTQPCIAFPYKGPYGTPIQQQHTTACVNLLKSTLVPLKLKKHVTVGLTQILTAAARGFGENEPRKALQNYCKTLFDTSIESGLFVCQALIGSFDGFSSSDNHEWLKFFTSRGVEITKALSQLPVEQMLQQYAII